MNTRSSEEKTGVTSTAIARYTMVTCPFGDLLVVTDDGTALTRLWLPPADSRTESGSGPMTCRSWPRRVAS